MLKIVCHPNMKNYISSIFVLSTILKCFFDYLSLKEIMKMLKEFFTGTANNENNELLYEKIFVAIKCQNN